MSSDQENNVNPLDFAKKGKKDPDLNENGLDETAGGETSDDVDAARTGAQEELSAPDLWGPQEQDPADPSGGGRRSLLARMFKRRRKDPKLEGDDGFHPSVETPFLLGQDLQSEGPQDEGVGFSETDMTGSEDPVSDPVTPPEKGSRVGGLFGRKSRKTAPLVEDSPSAGDDDPLPEVGVTAVTSQEAKGANILKGGVKRGKKSPKRGFPPIQVLIGWIDESSRKDVIAHARGFAQDHMETLDTAWIALAEFRGGTLFEIHEGGSGQAYLPELIEELSRDPEQVLWVPSGTKLNRVVTFSLSEGRPFSMMLNETDSARVRESGQAPIERTGKMRRLSPRGTSVLVVGATLFAVAFGVLGASAYLSASIDQQPLPALSYNPDILPHGQIVSLSSALRDDRWVSRILFENGAWRAEFETFDELVLPAETGEAQRLIDEAVERDAALQAERDRKIEELISE